MRSIVSFENSSIYVAKRPNLLTTTGILWGSGQVCSATSRVLVHESIKQAVIDQVVAKMAALKVGDTSSEEFRNMEGPQMGPVVNQGQYDKIWGIIDAAKAAGATFAYGGDRELVKHLGKVISSIPCALDVFN